jgi:hypothetical protein
MEGYERSLVALHPLLPSPAVLAVSSFPSVSSFFFCANQSARFRVKFDGFHAALGNAAY